MQTKWIEEDLNYDGSQLKSLYAYIHQGVLGDSIVAGVGTCDIPFEHMVDGEDLLAKAEIRGGKMLHFIFEKFNTELFSAVAAQRLCASLTIDLLKKMSRESTLTDQLRREGDDVFVNEKKLSISIATCSPVSCLVHFAVNVTNDNTPVATISLTDFGVDPRGFGQKLMEMWATEIQSMVVATQKVRPVGSF